MLGFFHDMPALWLAFGGDYLSHHNAPTGDPDHREKILVDLLKEHLDRVITQKLLPEEHKEETYLKLREIHQLLSIWSDDLTLIYKARENQQSDTGLLELVKRFTERIERLNHITLIPNGLISGRRSGTPKSGKEMKSHEIISLGIIENNSSSINWIQIDPGSSYHQVNYKEYSQQTSRTLNIENITKDRFTPQWFKLLISLKTQKPSEVPDSYYKEMLLYECLLAQLNGNTNSVEPLDDCFVTYTRNSPRHTWEVVEQSFRYLVRKFLPIQHLAITDGILLDFKTEMVTYTLRSFMQDQNNKDREVCRYLLNEMCMSLASDALSVGTEKQKDNCDKLVREIKITLNKELETEFETKDRTLKLEMPQISDTVFPEPNMPTYHVTNRNSTADEIKLYTVSYKYTMPQRSLLSLLDDFTNNFVPKLLDSSKLEERVALLVNIEDFLLTQIANTTLLDNEDKPFTENDDNFAKCLKHFGNAYFICATKIIDDYLDNSINMPELYTKNLVIQFYIYAGIAALNFRVKETFEILNQYNLSDAVNEYLSYSSILDKLILTDAKWHQLAKRVQVFFKRNSLKDTLYSYERFSQPTYGEPTFNINIDNDADKYNLEVVVALRILKNHSRSYSSFFEYYRNLEEDKYNRKWAHLTYSAQYLPALYCLLSESAYLAKASLSFFSSKYFYSNSYRLLTQWERNQGRERYWLTTVSFKVAGNIPSTKRVDSRLLHYCLPRSEYPFLKSPYENLVAREQAKTNSFHETENAFIASQSERPQLVDRVRYIKLGTIQSNQGLKHERLYAAIRNNDLVLSVPEENVLIRQSLFENSQVLSSYCKNHPSLILGISLLLIEKALTMRLRLSEHKTIGDILEITINLVTFLDHINAEKVREKLDELLRMLKDILDNHSSMLSKNTLVYLHAYLVILFQIRTITPDHVKTRLLSLQTIETLQVSNHYIDNRLAILMRTSLATITKQIIYILENDTSLLNVIVSKVIEGWDNRREWKCAPEGLLYYYNDYSYEPLKGKLYYQNKPIIGLPYTIRDHATYKHFFSDKSFPVIPSSKYIEEQSVECYVSVDQKPTIRLTMLNKELHFEELINGKYYLYLPADTLLDSQKHPGWLYSDCKKENLYTHWLLEGQIYVRARSSKILYTWDLNNHLLISHENEASIYTLSSLNKGNLVTLLTRFESKEWIQIVGKHSKGMEYTSDVTTSDVTSIVLPRFHLSFDHSNNQLISKDINQYHLSHSQQLKTLHGFQAYLLLENNLDSLKRKQLKVVIGHRILAQKNSRVFWTRKTDINNATVLDPPYFVYDLHPSLDILIAKDIASRLYLALLYYHTASHDNYDYSSSNGYQLSYYLLSRCWKAQPYTKIELTVLSQFLPKEEGEKTERHPYQVAIYLKINVLLLQSLKLSFLYKDKSSKESIDSATKLLSETLTKLNDCYPLYLRNLSRIESGLKLSTDEESMLLKHIEKSEMASKLSMAVQTRLKQFFEQAESFVINVKFKYNYKQVFNDLFSKEKIENTLYTDIIRENFNALEFSCPSNKIFITGTFNKMLTTRFEIGTCVELYSLALTTNDKVMFLYMVHYLYLRRRRKGGLPNDLCLMLARLLILVLENRDKYPPLPRWTSDYLSTIRISPRENTLSKFQLLRSLPKPRMDYSFYSEWEKMQRDDQEENDKLWNNILSYDLDNNYLPKHIPDSLNDTKLIYESRIHFFNSPKKEIVRKLFSQAAANLTFYRFFIEIAEVSDKVKRQSSIGLLTPDYIPKNSPFTFYRKPEAIQKNKKDIMVMHSVKDLDPKIDLTLNPRLYFHIKPCASQKNQENYPFAELANKNQNPDLPLFADHFYTDIHKSWKAHLNAQKLEYNWLSKNSNDSLLEYLRIKESEFMLLSQLEWQNIVTLITQERYKDKTLTLKWHSGVLPQINKREILTLVLNNKQLSEYSNSLTTQKKLVSQIVTYLTYEIYINTLSSLETLLINHKQSRSPTEAEGLFHQIIQAINTTLSQNSYCHPEWLLFQYENRILVRRNQEELILTLLNEKEKVMYQLDMGEGKSSVILPLLSLGLANGERLLRINVLQSQLPIMYDLLQNTYSGLLLKKVYPIPFSREIDASREELLSLHSTLLSCKNHSDIVLVTPEHRMCLLLKFREILLHSQLQKDANDIFDWNSYRNYVGDTRDIYNDLSELEYNDICQKQDKLLKDFLTTNNYLNKNDEILLSLGTVNGKEKLATFKKHNTDPSFREWHFIKAAYKEFLYKSRSTSESYSNLLEIHQEIASIPTTELLDESDEILKHGTELNYTLGEKYPFDGGDLRWNVAEELLKVVFTNKDIQFALHEGAEKGFAEVINNYNDQGGVPYIQLIDKTFFEKKLKDILLQIFLRIHDESYSQCAVNPHIPLTEHRSDTIINFIAGSLSHDAEHRVMNILSKHKSLADLTLMAKGWLTHSILFYVLNAKYSVKYGLLGSLTSSNKSIAVPYTGKDAPSLRSEFSHPDMMLGFTIVSYLYYGLSQEQVKQILKRIKDKYYSLSANKKLNSIVESGRVWMEKTTSGFPSWLTTFESLDLSDTECIKKAHHYLKYNIEAIYFYLNNFVFPGEAQQYQSKISANAHTLVSSGRALGFSGTNDRKITMPHNVHSKVALSQEGTNGKLLGILTQPRNSQFYCLKNTQTRLILKELASHYNTNPNTYAIIDAGALITGMSNKEAASQLLEFLPSQIAGIIYFHDSDGTLLVLLRNTCSIPLRFCYIDPSRLFAYYDDIHTRGTDLKLSSDTHGLLTLGLGMTKDKLTQASMRLRQLANSQSVSFWATKKVAYLLSNQFSISTDKINSIHILKWVTSNTINQIQSDLFSVTLRKMQHEFTQLSEKFLHESPVHLKSLTHYCQQREAHNLRELYAFIPRTESLDDALFVRASHQQKTFWEDIHKETVLKNLSNTPFLNSLIGSLVKSKFRQKLFNICNDIAPYLGYGEIHASLDNNEEKENEAEIVEEKSLVTEIKDQNPLDERSWDASLIHSSDFIQSNFILPIKSVAKHIYQPKELNDVIWHEDIFVTANFLFSVKLGRSEYLDNYLRPANMVLIHRTSQASYFILLTGEEAAGIKKLLLDDNVNKQKTDSNILLQLGDINGITQYPTGSLVSKQENKILSIIKLFDGQCHYSSIKESTRIQKRLGKINSTLFSSAKLNISEDDSIQIYNQLVEKRYLSFNGSFSKIINVLDNPKPETLQDLKLNEHQKRQLPIVTQKLRSIWKKCIFKTNTDFQTNQNTVNQWINTRARAHEYPGSDLESILTNVRKMF